MMIEMWLLLSTDAESADMCRAILDLLAEQILMRKKHPANPQNWKIWILLFQSKALNSFVTRQKLIQKVVLGWERWCNSNLKYAAFALGQAGRQRPEKCQKKKKKKKKLAKTESVNMLVTQSCPTLCNSMDCTPLGSSVHGISQARILRWVAIPFSRGSSWLRDRTQVSCIADRLFTIWATRKTRIGK